MQNTYLEPFIKELDNITSEVNTEFGSLSSEQLNWKPTSESWSIAQCLEHIIVTNSRYYPIMDDLIKGNKKRTVWERLPFYSGIMGKMLVNSMKAENKKVKTFKVFMPSESSISADIVKKFAEHQEIVKRMLSRADSADQTTIITSPVSKYITYSLQDANTIIVFHERRHINQAKKIKLMEGFPGK